MINDLDRTLREILTKELKLANGRVAIQFDQPNREWSSTITQPTLNLFLYDLRENNVLRQHQWQQIAQQNGNGLIQQKRTPFRVECHYILTAWAPKNPNRAEDEHQLLASAMLALFRHPELSTDDLQGVMKDQPFEISARLAAHDKLTNPAELWSALDNELRPSVSYIVTLAFDPWKEIDVPPVRTLTIRTQGPSSHLLPSTKLPAVADQSSEPEPWPIEQPIVPNPPLPQRPLPTPTPSTYTEIHFHFVVGRIHRDGNSETDLEVTDLEITIQGTNFRERVRKDGCYRLGPLAPGQYTLILTQNQTTLHECVITVPLINEKDSYDITLETA